MPRDSAKMLLHTKDDTRADNETFIRNYFALNDESESAFEIKATCAGLEKKLKHRCKYKLNVMECN